MNKSYSERGEDLFVMQHVKLPEKGFFLDVGCAWPCLYSNTAFLRDRGWIGCCIDGNASYEPSWKGVAPFTHCVIGDGKPAYFESHGVPELSRFGQGDRSEFVTTKRLDDLLQFSPHVDFLSIDTEGSEFDALQTFDWHRNQPICIIAEHSTYGIGRDERVRLMLEAIGYSVKLENEANYVFVKMQPLTLEKLTEIYRKMRQP
jgi:hypothetical protein